MSLASSPIECPTSFWFNDAEPILITQGTRYRALDGYVRDRHPLRDQFKRLALKWKQNRPRGADVHEMVSEKSYLRIIAMGDRVIPYILESLEEKPDHWFWALHIISDENPVPREAEGNIGKMAAAWIDWGRRERFIE